MSTSTIQNNIIYGLGEGDSVSSANMLAYALRWANSSYRDIIGRHRFKTIRTRTIFRTTDGQQTYQAPDDMIGFLTIKDEQNQEIIEQVTPEEMARRLEVTTITDESWTSDENVEVSITNKSLVQYSETVTTTDGVTTYTRDTDYTMNYVTGTIKELSTGTMSDATEYHIDYVHYQTQKPHKFSLEYDSSNERYVIRMEPVPDAEYICSLLYSAGPADLSGSVNPIWNRFEYAIERGGIYFGSLELFEDRQKRREFQMLYEQAVLSLVVLDQDLVPKRDRIRVSMRRQDYYDRQTGIWDDA